MPDWDDALQRMLLRVNATLAEPEPDHAEAEPGNWTGRLWLAAAATGQHRYRAAAEEWTERLRPSANSETPLRGFLFWYGAALGSLLLKSESAKAVALEGASGLGTLPTEANIETVPGGTPLLAWAGDREQAISHAQRQLDLCVREDGSVGPPDHAQSQAWAVLGFAQAARIDPDRFAPAARRVSDWWLEHRPAAGGDTAATAIAAAALLKLAAIIPDMADTYFKSAERIAEALIQNDADDPIWGDYFLFESLCALTGRVLTTGI